MSIFCKHDWDVKSETLGESVLEHIQRVGSYPGKIRYWDMKELTGKTLVVVMACKKCGKVKTVKQIV